MGGVHTIGKVAFTSSSYIALSVLMHFAISASWGAIYGVLAMRVPAALTRPTGVGLAYGLVVFFAMQLLLVAIHAAAPISVSGTIESIIAHTVFFGLPLAWSVRALSR